MLPSMHHGGAESPLPHPDFDKTWRVLSLMLVIGPPFPPQLLASLCNLFPLLRRLIRHLYSETTSPNEKTFYISRESAHSLNILASHFFKCSNPAAPNADSRKQDNAQEAACATRKRKKKRKGEETESGAFKDSNEFKSKKIRPSKEGLFSLDGSKDAQHVPPIESFEIPVECQVLPTKTETNEERISPIEGRESEVNEPEPSNNGVEKVAMVTSSEPNASTHFDRRKEDEERKRLLWDELFGIVPDSEDDQNNSDDTKQEDVIMSEFKPENRCVEEEPQVLTENQGREVNASDSVDASKQVILMGELDNYCIEEEPRALNANQHCEDEHIKSVDASKQVVVEELQVSKDVCVEVPQVLTENPCTLSKFENASNEDDAVKDSDPENRDRKDKQSNIVEASKHDDVIMSESKPAEEPQASIENAPTLSLKVDDDPLTDLNPQNHCIEEVSPVLFEIPPTHSLKLEDDTTKESQVPIESPSKLKDDVIEHHKSEDSPSNNNNEGSDKADSSVIKEEQSLPKAKSVKKAKRTLSKLHMLGKKSTIQDQNNHLVKKKFPTFENYVIEEEEGSGGYGTVYRAKRENDGATVAIKCPHAKAHKCNIINEVRMLEHYGGKNFIIKYEGRLKSKNLECLVLEYFNHDKPEILKKEINVDQIRWYGYCLFKALASLHKNGIVHRDVKPGNFLFSRKSNKGYLIDFNLALDLHQKYGVLRKSKPDHDSGRNGSGLATKSSERNDPVQSGENGSGLTSARTPSGEPLKETVIFRGRKARVNLLLGAMANHAPPRHQPSGIRKRVAAPPRFSPYPTPMPLNTSGTTLIDSKGKKEGPCAGTKGFRAPEVLLRSRHQSTKLDVWSAGVTLLYLITGKPPFYGDPEQNLKDIARLRGSEDIWELAKVHDRESSFPTELYDEKYLPRVPLSDWCSWTTKRRDFMDHVPGSLIDLLDKCLTVNPRLRIAAAEALRHEFFAPCCKNLATL